MEVEGAYGGPFKLDMVRVRLAKEVKELTHQQVIFDNLVNCCSHIVATTRFLQNFINLKKWLLNFVFYMYMQENHEAELNRMTREMEEKTREVEEKTREVEEKTREVEEKTREVYEKMRELQVSICNCPESSTSYKIIFQTKDEHIATKDREILDKTDQIQQQLNEMEVKI